MVWPLLPNITIAFKHYTYTLQPKSYAADNTDGGNAECMIMIAKQTDPNTMILGLPFWVSFVTTYVYSDHRMYLGVSSTAPEGTMIEKRENHHDDDDDGDDDMKNLLWTLVIVVIGGVLLIVIFAFVCRCMRSKQRDEEVNSIAYRQVN